MCCWQSDRTCITSAASVRRLFGCPSTVIWMPVGHSKCVLQAVIENFCTYYYLFLQTTGCNFYYFCQFFGVYLRFTLYGIYNMAFHAIIEGWCYCAPYFLIGKSNWHSSHTTCNLSLLILSKNSYCDFA